MKRTQIYLTLEQWRELASRGKEEHKSIAKIIREAINKVYITKREVDFEHALDAATGIWAGRTDIGTTEEYIRNLRKDSRLKRFGQDNEKRSA